MPRDRTVCPVCQQDWVNPVRIAGTEIGFWLCSECESVWLSEEWIDAKTSEYLADFMRSHNYDPSFNNIEPVGVEEQESG